MIDEGLEPANDFLFGPYPADRLVYRGDGIVEYETPSRSQGLGSDGALQEDGDPIRGAAILEGDMGEPTLLLLTVRLLPYVAELERSIIQQFEKTHSPEK